MNKMKEAKAALAAARRQRASLEKEVEARHRALEAANVHRKPDDVAVEAQKTLASLETDLREAERRALLVESELLRDELLEARAHMRDALQKSQELEQKLQVGDELTKAKDAEREAVQNVGQLIAKRERGIARARREVARAAFHLAQRAEQLLRAEEIAKAQRAVRDAVGERMTREAQQHLESLQRQFAQASPRDDQMNADAARLRARQVLTQLSGLRKDVNVREAQADYQVALEALAVARTLEENAQRQVARVSLAIAQSELTQATLQRHQFDNRMMILVEQARIAERIHGERSADYRRAKREIDRTRKEYELERQREHKLEEEIAARLFEAIPAKPGDEFSQLSAQYPILLFPVRIETRFMNGDRGISELRVRIYPDEILATTHNTQLRRSEAEAGQAFWTMAWNPVKEKEAWSALTVRYPPYRAAWIVRAMTPTNLNNSVGPPQFPAAYADLSTVPENYGQRAEARLLPDRWMILFYRNGKEVRREVSSLVREPLALTIGANAQVNDLVDISGDSLKLERDLLWTIDFEQGEKAGMALRVTNLTTADLDQGFDRILVLGVKSSLDPLTSSQRIADLFSGHRYTRGLALVRQGTATNNTGSKDAEFPPTEDSDSAITYEREVHGVELTNRSDGNRLLRAMGLSVAQQNSLSPYLAGANRIEDENAASMLRVLWPATWGYALEQMMEPAFSREAIEDMRQFAVTTVRGRGPLPAFRIGATPYGVLPVSSLAHWQSWKSDSNTEMILPNLLQILRTIWLAEVPRVARVGRTPNDPDKDLVEMLALDASARETRVRAAFGVDFYRNLFGLLGVPEETWSDWAARTWWKAREILARLGQPEWDVRLLGVVYDDRTWAFRGPMVTSAQLSETLALQPNYIEWLANASVDDLRYNRMPGGTPTALLYLMLRHAALLTYGTAAFDLHQINTEEPIERRDVELIGIVDGTQNYQTVIQRLDAQIPAIGDQPVKVFLRTPQGREVIPELATYQQTLTHLTRLPTAELERLFTETLDISSHRLDAWITALATSRLRKMREQNAEGAYIGAFAWVENLRRVPVAAQANRSLSEGRTLSMQTDTGGHVHAPSLAHAAAAAVLRNAFLSRGTEMRTQNAIDLSSARVRRALWLLDTLRNGQPLSAVFGYLIERGLDERQIQIYKEPLRQQYPMPTLLPPVSGGASETTAARDVINGWTFYQAAQPLANLQIVNAADRQKLEGIVNELREVADAVADLLTADAVHQIISGGTSSAASSLDALSKGARPPNPMIANTPRSGTVLTHRIAVVLDSSAVSAVPPWARTQRSIAEPALNTWAAQLLGDPDQVRCRTTYLDPQPADPDHRTPRTIRLSELGLAPLDILALAKGAEGTAAASVIDSLIAYHVLNNAPIGSNVEIIYEADPAWDRATVRTFPEILELARALNEVLSSARPLRPEDLLLPEESSAVQSADRRAASANTRADSVRDALIRSRNRLIAERDNVLSGASLNALRAELLSASEFGIGGAVPRSGTGNSATLEQELLDQVKSVLREIDERLLREAGETDAGRRVSIVFAGSLMFIPQFNVVRATELGQAITAAPAIARNNTEPIKWLQRMAKIRPGAWRWHRLGLHVRSLHVPLPPAEIIQLPYAAGAQWVALPFRSSADRPASGRISIAMYRPSPQALNVPWTGILVDEWNEIIPSDKELTGVSFHYDSPGAEAAQAILLAVPPTNRENWDLESLVATLDETFDLARVRAVDSDLLNDLGQFLPAIFLAANSEQETIETDFADARIGDPKITFRRGQST